MREKGKKNKNQFSLAEQRQRASIYASLLRAYICAYTLRTHFLFLPFRRDRKQIKVGKERKQDEEDGGLGKSLVVFL